MKGATLDMEQGQQGDESSFDDGKMAKLPGRRETGSA